MAVRCDGELHRQMAEVPQKLAELRVHTILTGAEIDGPYRPPCHHRSHRSKAKPVHPRRIAVAEGTSQIALVGQSESERKSSSRSGPDRSGHRSGMSARLCHGPVTSFEDTPKRRAITCM